MKLFAQILVRPLDGGMPFPIEIGGEPLRIGRDRLADICLPFRRVSKEHAVMQLQPTGVLCIFDRGSTNGTYVNSRKVDANVAIPVGKGTEVAFADVPGFVIEDIAFDNSTTRPRVRDTEQYMVSFGRVPPPARYPPVASSSAFPDAPEGASYREDNDPPKEAEMSTSKILEAHRGMTSDEAWEKWHASEHAIADAWKLFHENIEELLEQHPGRFVAIQDGKMTLGDSEEELTALLDRERPHIIIPIKRFPRRNESP